MPLVTKLTSSGIQYAQGFDEITSNPTSGYQKNLISYSQQFNQSNWQLQFSTLSSNTVIAPDGSATGSLLIEDTTLNNFHWVNTNKNNPAANTTFTCSCYFKIYSGDRQFFMQCQDSSAGGTGFSALTVSNNASNLIITSTTGSFTNGSYTLTPVNNGWYRASVTFTNSTFPLIQIRLGMYNNGVQNYNGNGTSGIYIWGAQLEQGSIPTPYQQTLASATLVPSNVTSRLDSTGTIYLAGQLDEVTFNTNINILDYKNLYSYSQKIDPIGNPDNRFWGNTNLTLFSSNSAIAPDGTLTAWTANNTPNLNSSFLNPNISNSSRLIKPNTYYTKSIYAKFVSGSPTLIFQLIRNSDSVYFTPQFNLQTGVATVSTNTSSNWGMNYINNGWWRCWGSFYSGANTAGGFSGDSFFIGGYGSTPLNTSHQYWGAQFEQGNTVSIYTATGAPANTSFATYSGPGVPITGFAARTDNAGNIYVTGNYDEVSFTPNTGARVNFIYSSTLPVAGNWLFANFNSTANAAVAPDGTTTATYIYETTTTAAPYAETLNTNSRGMTNNFVINVPYTWSIYVKSANALTPDRAVASLTVYSSNTSSNFFTSANLITGLITTNQSSGTSSFISSAITPYANGWYRLSLTGIPDTTGTLTGFYSVRLQEKGGQFLGDGQSGLYIWGPQLEKSTSATAFIPTGPTGLVIPQ
jgi:hypothetical protein